MANSFSKTAVLLTLALITVTGCKKKQKTTPASAAQAPTIIAATPSTVTAEAKPASSRAPENSPALSPEPLKTKPKPKPRPVTKKPSPVKPSATETKPAPETTTTMAKNIPPRIVVQAGEAPGGQPTVLPDMSHTDETHHRQTTEQLMQSTETNLKSLNRVLNADERSLLQQIRLFMAQSREATQSQDLVRAHNLALKAHLLSDELAR